MRLSRLSFPLLRFSLESGIPATEHHHDFARCLAAGQLMHREGITVRTLPLLLSSSMLLVASNVGAQSLQYPPLDTAPITAVVVTASPAVIRLREDEARQIAGTYDLSNGWRMKVRPSSRSIDATIDKQKPLRLLAVTPSKFVSGDGNVTMEFNRGDFGDEMTMSYSPYPGLADVVVISSAIAKR